MSIGRPIALAAFGMLLGASIGFEDGVIGLQAWYMLGQPDFFIRRNWGEVPHIVVLTLCGTLAGILYGALLMHMSHSCGGKLRLGRIYCSSMVVAIPIFFCAHYVVIAKRISLMMASFIPEALVFVLSIVLARYFGDSKESH